MSQETEIQLCDRWQKWCKNQGLEHTSADELLFSQRKNLTLEQRQYISQFIIEWETLMKELH